MGGHGACQGCKGVKRVAKVGGGGCRGGGGDDRDIQGLVAKALCSMLTRSNLIPMVGAGEPLHGFTQGDQSTRDYLRVS